MLKCISSGRRLAELDSIRETQDRAMSKWIGLPRSLTESFWCPSHLILSRNERDGGPASQSGSETQGRPEGVQSGPPNSSTSVLSASSQARISQTPNRDEYNDRRKTKSGQRLKKTNAGQVKKRPGNNNPFRVPDFALNINIDIEADGRSQNSVPVSTITRPESMSWVVIGRYSHLFQQGGAVDGSLFSRGIQNRTPEPGITSPYALPLRGTRGTRNSTQPSDNSSQPAGFEHPTPPTQESTGEFSSQMDASDLDDGLGSIGNDMADASQSPPGSTVCAPTLGKRRRGSHDTSGDAPEAKRRLSRQPHRPLFRERKLL